MVGTGHRAAVDAALLTILSRRCSLDRMRDHAPAIPAITTAGRPLPRQDRRAFPPARADRRLCRGAGTSESRLRVACARVAALSPAAMLDQRAMLDAKRALLYTNMSVAEVGYAIGFSDPAYFTRFFSRQRGRVSQRLSRAAGD
jgi:AraC family transcriptional activator of pobA